MPKNLVIVESPAKAKTIEKYLGKDFTVLSSIGHIRSIAKKVKGGGEPIDVKNGFKTTYEIDPDKKKTIAELKKAVKATEQVWLATDEDREGEAIAWHLCEVLGLDPKTTKRIVFHEITKSAIEEAVKEPRTVDMQLVQAQQARQILDRLVGFELSPVVWQKVPGGKSAGRVQSPAVRLLVEREKEIQAFEGSFQFRVMAEFTHNKELFKAELPKRFDTEAVAQKFLESLSGADFTVKAVQKSPASRNPGAPFTTSTLQQEANSKLGFGARATMTSAQRLYQEGKITYMRTDSVNLSGLAIAAAKEFITNKYGAEYSQVRQFKTKSSSAQEAHEAIRPTDMALEHASKDSYDQKLYDLIRNRVLASQMAPAKLEKTTVSIVISTSKEVFEAKGEVVLFDGFLKVYGASSKDPDLLPSLTEGDSVTLKAANARQTFARPPARFTEGSLVKKLEELGIGRPSTYATIIGTIQARDYAVKGENEGEPRPVIVMSIGDDTGLDTTSEETKSEVQPSLDGETVSEPVRVQNGVTRKVITEKTGSDRGKLVPTAIGEMITGFLTDHFDQVVDYDFTKDVEEDFDKIATGALARNVMLEKFYTPFHKLIEGAGKIERSEVAKATEVGKDPKSGKMIFARFGRFGPMLQLGDTESEEKPQFAPMPKGARIETVTLEQALKAFELPRTVGQTEDGQDIKANIGRFGPYIQVGKLFVSIKPLDPHDVTLEQALELYAAKLKAEAEKHIADFGEIKVLNGRFGPYVTDGEKNAKIAKDVDPKTLDEAAARKILDEYVPGKRPVRRAGKATKAAKTSRTSKTTKTVKATRTRSRKK
jgi:DNA topoisomerase I